MKNFIVILFMVFIFSLACMEPSSAYPLQPDAPPNPDFLQYSPLQFELPQAERKVLSNGISLHIMEDHELPLVKITALVKAGHAHDPIGKEGLAELTGSVMLTGGTQFMTGNEVDDSLAFMAAEIRSRVNLEYTIFTLSVMKKDLDRALEIFSQILLKPAFEQGKLQIARNLKIEELRRIADNPDDLAFRQYRKLIYKDDPRGRLSTFGSLEKIGRQDLLTFHSEFFSPQNTILTVSGDITGADALVQLDQHFGALRTGNRILKSLPPPAGVQASSLSLLSKETPQSIIIYGHLGPAITHPDFYPFTVLDFIIGSGGFRSRLFQEIRTKRGLAYSSGSIYAGRKDYGIFEAYAFTKAGSTIQVLNIMRDIIKKIQSEGITPEEIQLAKSAISNNFIFTFKTADDVVFQQMMLEYLDLPSDYLESYREKITAVNATDVKRMASKYLDLHKTVILVVGSETKFEAPLSSFGKFNREEIFKTD
ncbi:MAG: Peptidase M16 inactive domain protein [Syntrophus sp. PtaB.Bin075]|nr:MAG: Peptidase M16 inactive domain protein [Syntrophus sp. PtaB.Bin075]